MTICTRSLVEAVYPWISRRGGEVVEWGKRKWQTWSLRVYPSSTTFVSPTTISSTTGDFPESLSHGDLQHPLSRAQGHRSSRDLSHDRAQELGHEEPQDPPSASSNAPQVSSMSSQVEPSSSTSLTIGGIFVELGGPIPFRPRVTRWGKVYHTSQDCKYLNARTTGTTGRSLEGKFCSQCAAGTQQRPREGDTLKFELLNFTGGTVRCHVNSGCHFQGRFQEMTCCAICSKRH